MTVHTIKRTSNRASDVGRGFLALLGTLVLVIGVPVALVLWVGSPLPADVPTLDEVSNALRDTYIPESFLIKALALVCWLVWAELLVSLLVEASAYVRGRKAGNVPLAGGVQRGAARLIATVALLGALIATRNHTGPATDQKATIIPGIQPVSTVMVDDELARQAHRETDAPPAPAAPAPVYEVQRRDTLWDIAERHLGDPFRWREIFGLNQGKVQPDGRCLTDPDLIHAGWRLELPDDAGGLAPPAPAASPAPTAPSAPSAPPASAPDIARPTDDGGGMVLLDDGRDPTIVADAARTGGPEANDDGGGMVLLPDDDAQGPAPLPPPVSQPPGEQIAAGEG
jgi:hypothetical protein